MKKINELIKNKTIKNAGWIIGGKIMQMVVNLIVGLLMARYLGPANYGLINYGAAYTAFFSSFATLGINSVLVKEFVDHPKEEGTVIGTSLFLRFISSVLSTITIVSIVNVVDMGESETILVVTLCSLGLIFHIFEVINYWFQSKLNSKVSAIVTLIAYIITAVYKLVLMINGASVVWFALSTSIDYVCIALLLLYAYKKNEGLKFKISMSYGKELLKKSCYFILPGLMVAVYSQTDKIMLKQLISDTEIGFYSTAVSLSTIWCFVLQAIIDSIYPSIMKAYQYNYNVYVKRNKQLYAIIFYISMFVSIVFVIFAPIIIYIMYGEAYMPAVAPLRIIVWYTAFSYLGVARNAWIVCENKQRYLIYIYTLSALINVILNLLLIPKFGAVGAAIASLIAQIMTTMIVPLFIKELKENTKLMIEAILLKDIK